MPSLITTQARKIVGFLEIVRVLVVLQVIQTRPRPADGWYDDTPQPQHARNKGQHSLDTHTKNT